MARTTTEADAERAHYHNNRFSEQFYMYNIKMDLFAVQHSKSEEQKTSRQNLKDWSYWDPLWLQNRTKIKIRKKKIDFTFSYTYFSCTVIL